MHVEHQVELVGKRHHLLTMHQGAVDENTPSLFALAQSAALHAKNKA